jgi:NAD(P)-dependent dehydrogenase (short-subunit alcohol dehydrogenase family)
MIGRPLNPPIRDWRGLRVWVIGASSGIGAGLAQALWARGARVAVSARRGHELAQLVAAHGNMALALPLDVTDAAAVQPALDRIEAAWGGIDLAVLCAGTHEPVRAWTLETGAARRMLEINLHGVIHCLPPLVAQLLRQGNGGIAVVSSVAGYAGLPTSLVYGASKAALNNLTETLYLDLAPRGISVYLVCPGFVKTPLTDRNEFPMPALISIEAAAQAMIKGFERGDFEIHFPKRFTRLLKFLRLLPYRAYFALVRRGTGL